MSQSRSPGRLQRAEKGTIVDIQLTRLQKLLDERKITLDLDESARAWRG